MESIPPSAPVPPPLPPVLPEQPPPSTPDPLPPQRAQSISVGLAFASIGVCLAAQMGIQIVFALIGAALGNPVLGTSPWTMAVGILLSMGAVAGFLALFRVDLRLTASLGFPQPHRTIPAVVLLTVAGWIVSMQVGLTTERLVPMPKAIEEMFRQFLDPRFPFGLLLAVVVAAPIAEEYVCRGIVLPALQHRWGSVVAIVGSGLAFGAMHMNPWQFFYAALLGVTLGWLRVQSGSILPGILLHALNNLISWLLLIHPSVIPKGREFVDKTAHEVPTTWLLLSALIFPLGFLLLGQRRIEPPEATTP
jgi:membrane protease YdiL (CAAX protease family)